MEFDNPITINNNNNKTHSGISSLSEKHLKYSISYGDVSQL